MIEVFKTTLNLEELKAKRGKLNAKNFEIQLLGGSIGQSDKLIEDFGKCAPLLDNVVSVHTALTHKEGIMPGGNCDIGYLYERNVLLALDDACFIANIAGLSQNHRVGVVIHNSLSYEQFSRNPYFLMIVTETLGALLMKYPNIEFWIENVTPICKEHPITFKNGCIADSADICKHLRQKFGDRIGTVFDTCHAITTARILEDLGWDYVFPDMLEAFSGVCKEVHFANVRGYGLKQGQHGCGFDPANPTDVVKLEGLLANCVEYFPNAYLCYEITETDYIVNQQTCDTIGLVHNILNNW